MIRKEAMADVAKPGQNPFNEENIDDADIERIATNVRIISIRTVFSPVCLRTIPLYVLYCSAVILPDSRNWLSFSVVKALALANALKSAPVIWFFVARILCSI